MSDYVHIVLSVPLKPDAPSNLVETIDALLGPCHGDNGDRALPAAISGSIRIDFEMPEMSQPVVVRDGRLLVSAMGSNLNRKRSVELPDGTEVEADRSEIARLFDLVALHGDIPLGCVVGAIQGDWSYDMGGPIVMGGKGLVALYSGTQEFNEDNWHGGETVSMSTIPNDIAKDLVSEDGDWADFEGSVHDLAKRIIAASAST